jgi:solute carrier family 8 (sodium/calcium exchanger)
MEKEGLRRVLEFLEQQNFTVKTLITDRHKQINKWLRETYPTISHYFDIWHVAKGSDNCTAI